MPDGTVMFLVSHVGLKDKEQMLPYIFLFLVAVDHLQRFPSACFSVIYRFPRFRHMKYKEGNNRPSSVNQIALVHNHDKAGNKCYTQDNTNTRETPSVRIGA